MSTSSSYIAPSSLQPLTTIFTAAADCFDAFQRSTRYCNTDRSTTTCFIGLADSCYPPSPSTSYGTFAGVSSAHPNRLYYSPGVLPSGYTTAAIDAFPAPSQFMGQSAITVHAASGCPEGWNAHGSPAWCTQTVTSSPITFIGMLPMVVVEWEVRDLSLFTPASAPVQPTAAILQYESSVAARASSTAAKQTATTASTASTSDDSPHNEGLSTAAKIGIAVGVVVVVIALLALGFHFWRQRNKNGQFSTIEPLQRTESKRPYVDSKMELPDHEQRVLELAAKHDPQEIGSTRERLPAELPPAIPYASKPRIRYELASPGAELP